MRHQRKFGYDDAHSRTNNEDTTQHHDGGRLTAFHGSLPV